MSQRFVIDINVNGGGQGTGGREGSASLAAGMVAGSHVLRAGKLQQAEKALIESYKA